MDDLTSEDLKELLDEQAVENVRLEFKLERPDKDETLKKLSSFANTFGGYLIIGAKANSADGVLTGLPGIQEPRGFKQQIIQWCYDAAFPPIEVFVSPPIPAPSDTTKVCYVFYVPESEEAPHFLNSRKGVYISGQMNSASVFKHSSPRTMKSNTSPTGAQLPWSVKSGLSSVLKNGLMYL